MKVTGIIVEYNPLHNGHEYHLQKSKEQTNADILVAVMSGYFLQRGEPALVSKWERTKMALQAGADLVIELPYAFSTQKAETFASGAISILDAVGVSEVCFGSEAGSIKPFYTLVSYMSDNELQFQTVIKHFLTEGHSYPKAASLAFNELTNSNDQNMLDLSQPNNILGYHYVKAIKDQKSNMKASTIERLSTHYHDETFANEHMASATSIRKKVIFEKKPLSAIASVVPAYTLSQLQTYLQKNHTLQHWDLYFPYLKYKLLTTTATELREIYEAEEGLEYRLLKYSKESDTFADFMDKIKTKRYTWNRLQRLSLHILTNTTKTEMCEPTSTGKVPYLRLLGMTTAGQNYLRTIKKHTSVPLLTSAKKNIHPLLTLDRKAAACYALGFPKHLQAARIHDEYATPPLRYHEQTGIFL